MLRPYDVLACVKVIVILIVTLSVKLDGSNDVEFFDSMLLFIDYKIIFHYRHCSEMFNVRYYIFSLFYLYIINDNIWKIYGLFYSSKRTRRSIEEKGNLQWRCARIWQFETKHLQGRNDFE